VINTHIPAFLFIILLAPASMLWGQNTYVPDDIFEQVLIDLGYDDTLDVREKEISGLTGIENFTASTSLNCAYKQLTSLRCYNTVRIPPAPQSSYLGYQSAGTGNNRVG
jgi:hypothetical protein